MNLDPIEPYLPLVYGGIVLAVAVAFGVQHARIAYYKRENDLYAQAARSYKVAERQNLQTIGDLQKRLGVLVEQRRLDAVAAARAVADAQAEVARLQKHYNDETERLERLYANSESARAWGNVGVDAGVAARLPH